MVQSRAGRDLFSHGYGFLPRPPHLTGHMGASHVPHGSRVSRKRSSAAVRRNWSRVCGRHTPSRWEAWERHQAQESEKPPAAEGGEDSVWRGEGEGLLIKSQAFSVWAWKLVSTLRPHCIAWLCDLTTHWAANTAWTHLVDHMSQAVKALVVPVEPFAHPHQPNAATSQETHPEAKTRLLTVSVFSFSGHLRSQKDLGSAVGGCKLSGRCFGS